ncbi:glycoside hydrolase family 9 protein [Pararhizobium sp.]|uniref:glycoside hydrolase family 9 protein n=1 Tax=Pararhizobium sp. TaxID=1977563 RepID=UPI0027217642|nr:glycoside hydrolase family 9 protein [Pararhizobium sp.]MDO9414871.1 glycoside hydrolase family 9 protein [Pararhizobium sp.]
MTFFNVRAVALIGAMLGGAPAGHAADTLLTETFDAGQGAFWASGGVSLAVADGRLCADIPAGGDSWDRLVGINDLPLEAGVQYALTMTAQSAEAKTIPMRVQQASEPWTAQAELSLSATKDGQAFSAIFPALQGVTSQIVLQLGGSAADTRLCLDDVVLRQAMADEVAGKAPTAVTSGSPIRVNQSGYFLNGPKRATIISMATEPLAYTLVDALGAVQGEGMTEVFGLDPSANAETHIADFSAFAVPGEGYRLKVDSQESYPFAIGDDAYGKLRIDALSWFYMARSGTEILGSIAGEAYARPAGHIGLRPNEGDTEVRCLDGEAAAAIYGDWRCDYTLDVSGGWYDAGDQGKYVVNGGISVAQLLGTFERGQHAAGGASAVLSDSLSRIPENGNGVPDILDEARWELEFLLKMIVPDGQPLAGMAHHKVTDAKWTGVPMMPHLDPEMRVLHRPSTAATLNVAAAAAQGARLYKAYDPEFAERLLAAARKTFAAATTNPILYAPLTKGTEGGGGGDYADVNVTDEIYWAAAELYLTTGEDTYLEALKASTYWGGVVFSPHGTLSWADTAALGRLELALYGKNLPERDLAMIRSSVISAGTEFLAVQGQESFGHIYRPTNGKYDWGSNQLILQNMILVSAAYDLTGEKRYLDGVRQSMDYVLGRNAMNLSYVTGYGSVWSKNQHSRWFAHQVDSTLPGPPVGSLAGGPNSTMVDPIAEARLQGCAPQTCYVDDIMAWGSNEITINWNAPLVYIASFLADTR